MSATAGAMNLSTTPQTLVPQTPELQKLEPQTSSRIRSLANRATSPVSLNSCEDQSNLHYIRDRVAICSAIIVCIFSAMSWSEFISIGMPAIKHTILAVCCILLLNFTDADYEARYEDRQPVPLYFSDDCMHVEQLNHILPIVATCAIFIFITVTTRLNVMQINIETPNALHMAVFAVATSIMIHPKFVHGGDVHVRKYLQGNELWNLNVMDVNHDNASVRQQVYNWVAFAMLVFLTYAMVLAIVSLSHLGQFALI